MPFSEWTLREWSQLLSGDTESSLAQDFPFYPLAAPGMPPPGPNFIAHANAIARNDAQDPSVPESPGWMLQYLYCRALYEPTFQMPVDVNGQQMQAKLVTGHLWGDSLATGPVTPPTDQPVVMVIDKALGREDAEEGLHLRTPAGNFFQTALADAGIPYEITRDWYVTSLVRWMDKLNPRGGALSAKWIKDCLPLLHQELRLVRPQYIICLGAEATKAVIPGETLKSMAGRFTELKIPLHDMGEEEEYHVAKVMAITHPAAVIRNTEQYPAYIATLKDVKLLIEQGDLHKEDKQFDFRYIYTARELSDLVDSILAEPGLKRIAVDAEWHGEHPGEPGSYLRTIQFSHKPRFAAVVVLAEEGGASAFMPSHDYAKEQLSRLLDRDDVQIIGHFFQADLPWLEHFGIPIKHRFRVPDSVEELRNGEYAGGFDTALAAHAHDETNTDRFKLEALCVRYCQAARWDVELNKWKKEFIKSIGIDTEDDLDGYGMCPAEILLPYGAYDAAYTRELADVYAAPGGLLDRDRHNNNSWVPFHISMLAFPAFLEMHMVGLKVDRARVDELTDLYERVLNQKISEFRELINWPEFNPNSPFDSRELLFGEQFSGKIDKQTGQMLSVRPEGAVSLYLTPIKTSGQRSKPWARVVADGTWQQFSPCTDKEVLGILGASSPLAAKLRDIRFLQQVLKSVLRRPERDKAGNLLLDENGNRIYKGGLISFICQDDRVRSAFLQVMETGRASSKRPPLQNLSVDEQTEFLTERGWVFGRDLTATDRLAQYHKEDGSVDFVKPSGLVKERWKTPLVHLTLKRHLDLMVTPNHRCLLRRRKRSTSDRGLNTTREGLFEVLAEDFKPDNHHFVAGWYVGGSKSLTAAEVTWLTAVQADGSYMPAGGIKFVFIKQRKFDRLVACLQAIGEIDNATINYERRTIYVGPTRAKKLIDWTRQLMPDKKFGAWLLEYDRSTLDLFCDEVFFWDGNAARKDSYFSTPKENADWVQILWSLSGRRARLRQYTNSDGRSCYCVDSSTRHVDYVTVKTENFKKEMVPYDGYVYCVTVPSQFIMVRRNGIVAVTGNSNRRENDYRRILDDSYTYAIRSIFISDFDHTDEPTVILGADYSGAELLAEAVMARDPKMIDHCLRSALPEDHPDYYDIHSNIAVLAFNLNCKPTKTGLKDAGKKHLRIAAKNIIFGVGYGRSAEACARQCNEEADGGEFITVQQAQQIIDAIFELYSCVPPYQERCRARVRNPGWMKNAFGRIRRFVPSNDLQVLGELERQALNFPMQSLVADGVSLALHHLMQHERKAALGYKVALQLHDAIYLEVPVRSLDIVYHEIMPECMVDRVSFRSCNLDGIPYPDSPEYRFSIDRHVYVRWGGPLTVDRCDSLGISREYAHGGDD